MTPTPARLALVRACATAYTHINDRTLADATQEEVHACVRDLEVRLIEAQVEAFSIAEDLPGTQGALQRLNRSYKAALVRVRAQAAVSA